MKKICYVTTIGSTIKAFFLETLQALNEQGYEVTVICNYDIELKNILPQGVRYIPIKMNRGIDIVGSIRAIKSFYRIFRQEKFDLIQYSTPNASFYAAVAAFFAHIHIRVYHNMGFICTSFTGIKKTVFLYMERVICRLSNKVQFTSKENLKYAVKNKIVTKDKAYIIWNGSTGGVSLDRFNLEMRSKWSSEIRNKYGIASSDFVIGFVGRINMDKGINELLKAFKNMKIKEDIKLLIVGKIDSLDGIDNELWNWAQTENSIIFSGEQTEIEKYYAALNILILPSFREGFGNVIIEAAAMATPTIASDIPGPRDIIIHGETGFLTEVKNVEQLCEKFEDAQKNRERISLIGKAAYKDIAKKYDSRVLIQKILEDKKTYF